MAWRHQIGEHRAPMRPRDMLLSSATRLAKAIANGETTSVEVVRAHAEHAERHDPFLNAIVESRLTAALREAEEADRKLARGEKVGPLHGVPCTIKESFAVTGMPLTAGLVARIGTRSTHDAVAVQRLRDAGAIVIGVTNISELLMWMESNNRVYGRCNNPYDPTRTVGGSSGGEGAAVGAGFVPFGLGADIGGSIRLPALMNGVFGHKPSGGLIPNAGQWPIPGPEAMRFVTTGPLTRRAEDLWPLVRVLAGPSTESPEVMPLALGEPHRVSIDGLRVLSIAENGLSRVHPSLVRAQEHAAEALEKRGAKVERAKVKGLAKSVLYWAALLSEKGGEDFGLMLGGGQKRVRVARELVKLAIGRSMHTLPALALAAVEIVPKLVPGDTKSLVKEALAFRRELEDRIGDGVMLYPTYTLPAPHHNVAMTRPIDWAYTALINVMELPSTAVPLGLDKEGVPLGCQVIARHAQDHRTVAVAVELEKAFGGWVPPPRIFG
jgi:fatty acid amide hydrolase 2